MARLKTETVTKVSTEFELKLPKELDPEPRFVVPVSKNYTARVYDSVITEHKYSDKKGEHELLTTPCFRLDVRHNKTGVSPSIYGNRESFKTLLECSISIRNIAAYLRPKTKTITSGDDPDV